MNVGGLNSITPPSQKEHPCTTKQCKLKKEGGGSGGGRGAGKGRHQGDDDQRNQDGDESGRRQGQDRRNKKITQSHDRLKFHGEGNGGRSLGGETGWNQGDD